MEGYLTVFSLLAFPAAFLAIAPAAIEESLKAFAAAFVKALILIVLPFWTFLGSCVAFEIAWKGECPLGWLTCFHSPKIFLFPFVLWALAALYVHDVCPKENADMRSFRNAKWVTWGIFSGAVISTFCFVHGFLTLPPSWGLLIPFYTCGWFVFRGVQLFRDGILKPLDSLWALLWTLPGWIPSLYFAYLQYLDLPDTPPTHDCFIVTAASHGHRRLVGRIRLIEHGGRTREANHQLIVFWEFERLWQERLPRLHRAFRAVYNRIGPVIARRVRGPFAADAVYLMLKPVEWGARVVVFCFR